MSPPRFSQVIQLARQNRFGAACIILAVLLPLLSLGLLRYQRSLADTLKKRQAEGEAVNATLISGPQMRQELTNAKEITARIDANLASDDLEKNAGYFYQMEEQTKAHIDDIHPLSAPTDNNPLYKRVPFSLRASGTYQQIVSFIYSIETGPRLANITYFGLRRRGQNSPAITLDMSLELLGKK